ncbi:MAG: glycosyltransferase family 2 protein [Pseudomonadota bacterium]
MKPISKRRPVEIVVCVHNSPEDVRRCLSSVRDTMSGNDSLLIIDDGSADETRLLCERISAGASDKIRLIRRPAGTGFCKAANAGLRETSSDIVILLNSDTIVSGDWIDRIAACMMANWQIGIVGPLSNAGGWQSIPKLPDGPLQSNPMRDDLQTLSAVYQYCRGFRERFDYPIVEQINGFCMALSRPLLQTVGLFDEERFPMGYGEENDLTFRAMDAGFLCSVAIDCFVYHAKTKSYTPAIREKYNLAGQVQLHDLHGRERVMQAVVSTQNHPVLRIIRSEAETAFSENGWSDLAETPLQPNHASEPELRPLRLDTRDPAPKRITPEWSAARLSYDDI